MQHSTYAHISSWEQVLVFRVVNEKLRFKKVMKQSSNVDTALPIKVRRILAECRLMPFRGKLQAYLRVASFFI